MKKEETSTIRRRPSRRAVLQSASIAPLLVIASRALAEPSESNLEIAGKRMPLPKAYWRKIDEALVKKHEPKDYPGEDDSVRKKYILITSMLWNFFHAGVSDYSRRVRAPDSLLWVGYEEETGEKVFTFISQFGDDDGHEPSTAVCAYQCGYRASEAAYTNGAKVVTPPIYLKAWADTKDDWNKKLTGLRNRSKDSADMKIQGFGC